MQMERGMLACLTFCRFSIKMGRVEREVDFAVWKTLRYGMALLYVEIWIGGGGGLDECCGDFPSGFSGNLNVPYWVSFVIFELEGERKGGWWW